MKIISWNVNGLRSAYKKGFLEWFRKSDNDIVCLQEIRARKKQLPSHLIKPKGYWAYFNPAQKKGYSGTAIYTREKPKKILKKLKMTQFDQEGRILELKYLKFSLLSLYFPHGGRKKEKINYKLKAYFHLFEYLKKRKNQNILLAGDFNIAHQEIDLARPKQNKNNTMFTPKERLQLDKLTRMGFTDTFRKLHPKTKKYTWWPYYRDARKRNLGWRIDYIFTSERLVPKIKKAFVLSTIQGSDHCPIGIEISG